MSKPSIVLIHGAWHCGAHFSNLKSLLESHDYEVITLDLPSVGADPTVKSAEPDFTATRSAVEKLLDMGKDVVVVGHSYGGFVVTQALEGLGKAQRAEKEGSEDVSGVIGLLYIASSFPRIGLTARDLREEGIVSVDTGDEYDLDMKTLKVSVRDPRALFYHDVDLDISAQAISLLKHQSLMVFETPCTYLAYLDIPSTYLVCEDDKIVSPAKQRQMLEFARTKAGANIDVQSIPTGHSPWLVDPRSMELLIRKIAGETGL